MKVLFLAENPQVFIEYAVRLENNHIPFWTANNINDFHHILSRMSIDVVFADYNFLNFSDFDVYKHIDDKKRKFVFLYLNEPSSIESLFIRWEDSVTENCPELWTQELESLLRIAANQPFLGDFSFESATVQDLVVQLEGAAEEGSPRRKAPAAGWPQPADEVHFTEGEAGIPGARGPGAGHQDEGGRINGIQTDKEKSLVEDFLRTKRTYNMSFSEFLLLDLLRRRKNEMVSIADMMQLLDIPRDEKNMKRIYRYIYCIRNYLQNRDDGTASLVRVKKGVYSLVCDNLEELK